MNKSNDLIIYYIIIFYNIKLIIIISHHSVIIIEYTNYKYLIGIIGSNICTYKINKLVKIKTYETHENSIHEDNCTYIEVNK